jgi:hypothetical protein
MLIANGDFTYREGTNSTYKSSYSNFKAGYSDLALKLSEASG